jgi:hypothetical protein
MASLYARGWRQGSILVAEFPHDTVVLDKNGRHCRRNDVHERWAVASQNCDLDLADETDAEPTIELRPVYTEDPPSDWGIRSARCRLTEVEYVVSASPRAVVAPNVLAALLDVGAERRDIAPERALAFTTWLGKRYDRPAVPTNVLPLARRIAEEVQRQRNRAVGQRVRDVLMQFDEAADPPRFSLFAVLHNADDEDDVRAWLAGIAQAVPAELGIADELEAATAERISLHLIETSYAADVTQLTWRPNQPAPQGAT